MNINLEKKIIKIALMIFFAGLIFVYAFFFQHQGYDIFSELINKSTHTGNDLTGVQTTTLLTKSEETGNQISTGMTHSVTIGNSGTSDSIADTGQLKNNFTILPGTEIRYGDLEIIDTLGISYKYILKDKKNGYFIIYLGNTDKSPYNFASIAKALGGNTVAITKENDIKGNSLPGETEFINLKEYKNKQVLMVIHANHNRWLVMIKKSLYYDLKEYIKNQFNKNL